MITQQQRDLRNAIVKHAEKANLDLNTTTYSLIVVLGSVIEGIPVERALGSPGSWGYGTPIGDALLALIQSRPAEQITANELIEQLATEGGAIVSSGDCSEMEIADAQATGRFSVREDGMGFVRHYAEWVDASKWMPQGPHEVIATDMEGRFLACLQGSEWWCPILDEPIDSVVTHWMELPELPEE